jgi:hypothetical protein
VGQLTAACALAACWSFQSNTFSYRWVYAAYLCCLRCQLRCWWRCPLCQTVGAALYHVALQDLAATAIAGGELPDKQSPEDMAGDYSWDCEYNFDLAVRHQHIAHNHSINQSINQSIVHLSQ